MCSAEGVSPYVDFTLALADCLASQSSSHSESTDYGERRTPNVGFTLAVADCLVSQCVVSF
jgi:hypothetical protein